MEKILIDWLSEYTQYPVNQNTKFTDLNFDIFDQAMTVDFVQQRFQIDVNKSEIWFDTVRDLINFIAVES
jgi:acyl carrier protein